jgi:hypothetical protein
MAQKRKSQVLNDAKKYYKLLLYEASGGTLGSAPEGVMKGTNATFSEKRGLLDSIIKVAQLEDKANEGDDQPSGLDMIRKQLNGNRTDRGRRDNGGTGSEGGSDEPDAESDTVDSPDERI